MKKERCIIIPAIKKNAVIPDQLVKKLAGKTLIQRAIDTARAVLPGQDIYVVTDSEEISLICRRNKVEYYYQQQLRFDSLNIIKELMFFIELQTERYSNIIIYRATAPLVTDQDIQAGYNLYFKNNADVLVTLKKEERRIWKTANGDIDSLINDMTTETIYLEIKSFLILKAKSISKTMSQHKVVPYFLGENAVEINNYQDWWICEKLLKRKRIVFVVTGYPAIGLGHIYRALTLAHEITDHRCIFLCTKSSELAVRKIAEKDYYTILQQGSLVDSVLDLQPDLVINDILNTDPDYMKVLRSNNIRIVNFEDTGSGADFADLIINALYQADFQLPEKYLVGPEYFCLRDEFIDCTRNDFSKKIKNILVTFGGTDPCNFTLHTLKAITSICEQNNIKIYIVTGPGYAHKKELLLYFDKMQYKNYEYIDKTGVMSSIMEKVDCAVSAAGRTVFELAHMRIPSIILSQHEREDTHTFGRPENGFEYLGVMKDFDSVRLQNSFKKIMDNSYRLTLYNRMKKFDFESNKKRVIDKILSLLAVEN